MQKWCRAEVKRCSVGAEVQWCWCWCKGAEMEVLRCCLQRFFSRCGFAGDSCCAGAEDLQWFSRGSAEVQRCSLAERGAEVQVHEVQVHEVQRYYYRGAEMMLSMCGGSAEVFVQRGDCAEQVLRFSIGGAEQVH